MIFTNNLLLKDERMNDQERSEGSNEKIKSSFIPLEYNAPKGVLFALNQTGAKDLFLADDRKEAKELIESGKYRKVQASKIIEDTGDNAVKEIIDAIIMLKPIYESLI